MKVRVYAKPKRAPKWWPRDDKKKPAWVGLFNNGIGWTVGRGDLMFRREAHEVQKILEEDQGRRFDFRVEGSGQRRRKKR